MRALRFAICAALLALNTYPQDPHPQDPFSVRGDLHSTVDDYLTAIAKQDWAKRSESMASMRTPEQVRARQAYIRSTFTQLMGGFPHKTPLNARITGSLKREGYRVDNLIFESRPQFFVTANLYVPAAGRAPHPAVIGVAGHSDISKAAALYQRGWIALAKRGFLVLAFDPAGQGERTFYYDAELGRSRIGIASAEHTHAGLQCFLTGSSLAQYFAWDGVRAFDYLLTRSDVDPKRIAVAGNSGGGMQSAYLAVVEPRLAAAAPSCFLTSSETLWFDPGPQDAEQNVPGFLSSGLNVKDFAIAFAPKPLEFMTATRDFFPIAGAHDAFAEAQRTYQVLGAADHVAFFEYNDTHGWSRPRREATYAWFGRWLNRQPEDPGVEPAFLEEPASHLNATSTGQLATSLGGETVPSLNAALALRLARERAHLDRDQLRTRVLTRLGLETERPKQAPAVTTIGSAQAGAGYRLEKLVIATEPGIQIPALLFSPNEGAARKPAVIYVDAAGKAAGAAVGSDIEGLVKNGRVVLAADLRGLGETENHRGSYPHNGRYQTSLRALLLGKTMAGMQTFDLLRCFDYLLSREDVDPARIGVMAKGNTAVPALFAAMLERRIYKVACEGGPVSYLDLASMRFHGDIADVIIPGVLQDFDLPDVLSAIAPRTLWIVDPRMPSGAKDGLAKTAAEYAPVAEAFKAHRANARFRISGRTEGWSFDYFYKDWLGTEENGAGDENRTRNQQLGRL